MAQAKMTRQHYQLIAEVIYEQRGLLGTGHLDQVGFKALVNSFDVALERTNDYFNSSRFYHAAGWCDIHQDLTLPDDAGKCSLCHSYKV